MDAMLRSMTARQFYEWMHFAEVEPFGEPREDARVGLVTQLLANVYRDKVVHPRTYSLEECVPQPAGDAFAGARVGGQRQSWQAMKAIAMLISGASWEEN